MLIARFNLPIKTSIKLFNTYISPIILYNAENWAILSNNKLKTFTVDTFFTEINDKKDKIIHRKCLKFILGVTKSCPTLAIMGDLGEIPLILKGYIQMLKYWHRVRELHHNTFAN